MSVKVHPLVKNADYRNCTIIIYYEENHVTAPLIFPITLPNMCIRPAKTLRIISDIIASIHQAFYVIISLLT